MAISRQKEARSRDYALLLSNNKNVSRIVQQDILNKAPVVGLLVNHNREADMYSFIVNYAPGGAICIVLL